jgi:hypothetical protein
LVYPRARSAPAAVAKGTQRRRREGTEGRQRRGGGWDWRDGWEGRCARGTLTGCGALTPRTGGRRPGVPRRRSAQTAAEGLRWPGGAAGRSGPERADAAAAVGGEGLAWISSLLAALAHEVTAAGCVLAATAAASERSAAECIAAEQSQASELDELLRQRDAARRELAVLRELAERRERLALSEQAEQQQPGAGRELPAAGSGDHGRARKLAPLRACP